MRSSMSTHTALSAAAGLAVAVTALFGLTACSGSGSEPSTADSATSTSAATPTSSAKVSPPAINNAGELSVCTPLPLGAKPLFYFDANNQPAGVAVDLGKAFSHELGLKYVAVSTSFPSLIPSLQGKKCDVIMGSLFITPPREQQVDFVPYLNSAYTFVGAPNNPKNITGLDDSLCGIKVVTTTGQSSIPLVQEQSKTCQADGKGAVALTQVDSAAVGEKMVSSGQADAYMATVADLVYAAKNSDGAYQVVGEPFDKVKIGAAVTKGNSTLQKAIQDAFTSISSDGSYKGILDKYGLGDLAYTD